MCQVRRLLTLIAMSIIAQILLLPYAALIRERIPHQGMVAMNVSIGDHWEKFVADAVRHGRYGSASEVVREGLRLVEEREEKLKALRAMLDKSFSEGGEADDDAIDAALDARAAQLSREGY